MSWTNSQLPTTPVMETVTLRITDVVWCWIILEVQDHRLQEGQGRKSGWGQAIGTKGGRGRENQNKRDGNRDRRKATKCKHSLKWLSQISHKEGGRGSTIGIVIKKLFPGENDTVPTKSFLSPALLCKGNSLWTKNDQVWKYRCFLQDTLNILGVQYNFWWWSAIQASANFYSKLAVFYS